LFSLLPICDRSDKLRCLAIAGCGAEQEEHFHMAGKEFEVCDLIIDEVGDAVPLAQVSLARPISDKQNVVPGNLRDLEEGFRPESCGKREVA
jgi:hypothetical protein